MRNVWDYWGNKELMFTLFFLSLDFLSPIDQLLLYRIMMFNFTLLIQFNTFDINKITKVLASCNAGNPYMFQEKDIKALSSLIYNFV